MIKQSCAALAILFLCCGAPAEPPEVFYSRAPVDGARFRASFNGRQVAIVDAHTRRELMGGTDAPLFSGAGVVPEVVFEAADAGADLTLTYRNDSDSPKSLGTITLDGVRFAPDASSWQFQDDSSPSVLSGYSTEFTTRYPENTYSPVIVISDADHSLGMSLLYPLLAYDQPVTLSLVGIPEATADQGLPHWAFQVRFGSDVIGPGETRSYTLAIRAATRSQSVLATLLPYRQHFQRLYGSPAYVRDPRRVGGEAIAQINDLAPGNPRGYKLPEFRPDLNGWQPWVQNLLTTPDRGYQRIMLWAPSGVMAAETGLNFPFRFMTPINDLPAARQSLSEFRRVPAAGIELGFWWGNSVTVTQGWDHPVGDDLNPDNPEHVALAMAELDLALQQGARLIGLDAFKQRSPARAHRWLGMMQAHAPNVTFVIEHAAADFMHTLAPSFNDALHIQAPHILADFLNPGHETWAAIRTTRQARDENRPATPAETNDEVQRVESLGYVALVYGRVPMTTSPPVVRSPAGATRAALNSAARISVTVDPSDGSPPTYRWRKDGVELVDGPSPDGGVISGSDSSSLLISGVALENVGVYSVLVRTAQGDAASAATPLLVVPTLCPADVNADGNLDPDDIGDFITCFFGENAVPGACPAADYNASGGVDPDDLGDFITAYFTGCG